VLSQEVAYGGGIQQSCVTHERLALGIALGSSVLTVLGLMVMIKVEISRGFRSYVEQSLKADLQSPKELLKVYGGKGAVVVAVDKWTNQVVGMVAGQEIVNNKEEESMAGGGVIMYELRRMSVDTRIQRRGIGQRLIRQLENELPRDKQKVIRTCSSIQYAAHALYKKAGFTLRETMPFSGFSWLLQQGGCFRRYEKDYDSKTI
jgi:ribosomal protein S18 acetylase RimI-like enzyme